MRNGNPIAVTLAAALLGGAALAAPATDAQKCEAAFESASAKFGQCRLSAESKFTRTNDDAKRTGALARCSTKLEGALDRAVTKYGSGDCTAEAPAAFDAFLAQCASDVEAAAGVGGALPAPADGGPLTNGGVHTGEILSGDADLWTFSAGVGERIDLHVGEIAETDDFRPWLRLLAPDDTLLGATSGVAAAAIEGVASIAGTYLVLVSSFDSSFDGAGTYRLTAAKTQGAVTVSDGDQGGPLTSPVFQPGEILRGDLDVWTVAANAGDTITVHLDEVDDADDFAPWVRLWAPDGSSLANAFGLTSADIGLTVVPVTGTYLVLVASFDSGFDGTGTYELSVSVVP
jgi:hypothetical protein